MARALTTTRRCRQALGHGRRLLVMALVFVFCISLLLDGVHSDTTAYAPAPTPTDQPRPEIPIHQKHEVDALNTILTKWSPLNPQLTTLLNWTSAVKPCEIYPRTTLSDLAGLSAVQGAWGGVSCRVVRNQTNSTGDYYDVFVTALRLYGSNSSCGSDKFYPQCGFEGITGELPSEIGNLTNLEDLAIRGNPNLTGLVPVGVFQLPRLGNLWLDNNSLSGTLPSDVLSTDCQLQGIDVSYNNFSGNLSVSPEGFLFCRTLQGLWLQNNSLSGSLPSDVLSSKCQLYTIDVSYNNFSGNLSVSPNGSLFCPALDYLYARNTRLDGPLNFENLIARATDINLTSNHFNGALSIGPLFSTIWFDISNNNITAIHFENSNNTFIQRLANLNIAKNQLSGQLPNEILQMGSLYRLYQSFDRFLIPIKLQNLNKGTLITSLNISYNKFSGTLLTRPYLKLAILDVSNNNLTEIIFGEFNSSTTNNGSVYMPSLQELFMQNNNLRGAFPDKILLSPTLKTLNCDQNGYETLELPDLPINNYNLSHLYLTNNQFRDPQYASKGPLTSINLQYSNILFLGGNPYCDQIKDELHSTVCRFDQSSSRPLVIRNSAKNKIIIATTTSLSFALMLLVSATYIWRLMHRIESLRNILKEFEKNEVQPNLYSYKDIKVATNNFDKNHKLGEGGFGVVFKGKLKDNTDVAVKKLILSSQQVLSDFLHEVVMIAGLKHRNLVKLKGCCLGDGDQRMLVFEYVENKNLAEALWPHDNFESLVESPISNWNTRFNIILGTARGLAYLHEELQSPIIHRDIKAANILLDKDYNPKIADFGLAYMYPMLGNEASHLTLMPEQLAGTRGYCAPEYVLHGHISTSLDVYSFGVVVLEVVSGRKNFETRRPEDEMNLREWAWKQYEGQTTMMLIDPKMKHSPMDLEAMVRVISVALMCVHYKPSKRPKMHDVVSMLCGRMIIEDFSRAFEYGEQVQDGTSDFYMASGTTSYGGIELSCIDECNLLSNNDLSEMYDTENTS